MPPKATNTVRIEPSPVTSGAFELHLELYRTFNFSLEDEIDRQMKERGISTPEKASLYEKWKIMQTANQERMWQSRLECLLEQVRTCTHQVIEAYEKAAEDNSTKEDFEAYKKTLRSIKINPDEMDDEVRRIADQSPTLRPLAEMVREHIRSLRYLI